MSKTAFLFPGQGSQFAGMGKSLAEAYPEAARVFEGADAALGFALSRLCFEGPEDQLKLTENQQPALLAVSIAAYSVLRKRGVAEDYVAGHSLGEYSALVAAGSLDFADALRLVRKRGQYMQEAVPAGIGAMAALLKLPAGRSGGSAGRSRPGRNCQRGQSQFARPDRDRRARGRGCARNGSGQGRRRPPSRAASGQRSLSLCVDETGAGAAEGRSRRNRVSRSQRPSDQQLAGARDSYWRRSSRRAVQPSAQSGALEPIPSAFWLRPASRRFIEVGAGGVLMGLLRNIDPSLTGVKFGEAADWDKLGV